jgi:hypothetical protein
MNSACKLVERFNMAEDSHTKARERFFSARLRDVEYELRHALSSGGFHPWEVDAIVEVIISNLRHNKTLDADEIAKSLHARGFPKDSASDVARELVPHP